MRVEIEKRLIRLSVNAYKLTSKLKKADYTEILSNQLLRSLTSSALNYGEAQGAESDKDFTHKIALVIKELRESYINLKIISESGICSDKIFLEELLNENNELIAIFYTTFKSLKKKAN